MLKSFQPTLSATQLNSTPTDAAAHVEESGADRDSGACIVMAPEATRTLGLIPAANFGTFARSVRDNGKGVLKPG